MSANKTNIKESNEEEKVAINLKQNNLSYFILRWLLMFSKFLSSMRIKAQVLPNRAYEANPQIKCTTSFGGS